MNYKYLLSDIYSDDLIIEKEWYYHAFDLPMIDDNTFDMRKYKDMVKNGIKSRILQKRHSMGYNGYYYVSLTKDEECENSIFQALSNLPMFIINPNIKVIKTKCIYLDKKYPGWLSASPLPFRCSPYNNEYQKFLKVKPEQIIGLRYNISEFLFSNNNDKYKLLKLKLLKQIIESSINTTNIPIIDTNEEKEIDKYKCYCAIKKII